MPVEVSHGLPAVGDLSTAATAVTTSHPTGDRAGQPAPGPTRSARSARSIGSGRQPVVAWVGPSRTVLRASADAQLVGYAREEYPAAFEELVRRHQGRAYTVALGIVVDRGDAEDVTQTALVKAWQNLARFDARSSFATWLYRIVVNECLSFTRGRRPSPTTTDDLDAPAAIDVQRTVEDAGRNDALRRGVRSLPVDQRAALVLTGYLGHSHEEAAVVLGVPASTVRGRTARARRTLLLVMKEWA